MLDNSKVTKRINALAKLSLNAKVNHGKKIINFKNERGEIEMTLSTNKQFIKTKVGQKGHSPEEGLIVKFNDPLLLTNPINEKEKEWYYISFSDKKTQSKYSSKTNVNSSVYSTEMIS